MDVLISIIKFLIHLFLFMW